MDDEVAPSIAGDQPVTLINIFTVPPERQDDLLQLLRSLTEVMAGLPGFVSADLHRSLDGRHVANHAQWRSAADWKAMVRDPRIQACMGPVIGIATFEPRLYGPAEVGHPTEATKR